MLNPTHKGFGIVEGFSDRPTREFVDAESELSSTHCPAGGWGFGARRMGETWRVILRVEHLGYDILLPGEHTTKGAAVEEAYRLSIEIGGPRTTNVPRGDA